VECLPIYGGGFPSVGRLTMYGNSSTYGKTSYACGDFPHLGRLPIYGKSFFIIKISMASGTPNNIGNFQSCSWSGIPRMDSHASYISVYVCMYVCM
jgi:hypothetical protein